jgi:hypothetical protein
MQNLQKNKRKSNAPPSRASAEWAKAIITGIVLGSWYMLAVGPSATSAIAYTSPQNTYWDDAAGYGFTLPDDAKVAVHTDAKHTQVGIRDGYFAKEHVVVSYYPDGTPVDTHEGSDSIATDIGQ